MKKLTILIIILNLTLAGVQLMLTAMRSSDGAVMAEISSQVESISQENQQLKSAIYEASSLKSIQTRSHELSLTPVSTKFLNFTLPVAAAL